MDRIFWLILGVLLVGAIMILAVRGVQRGQLTLTDEELARKFVKDFSGDCGKCPVRGLCDSEEFSETNCLEVYLKHLRQEDENG